MPEKEKPWFSEEGGFFGPTYLVGYEMMVSHEATLQQVDFLERVLSLKPGMKILDLPCGHGRHAIALAKRGYDMVGVDLSTSFLDRAKEAAQKDGVSIDFQQGDMRDISFDGAFDAALNLFTSIGYFDDDREDQKVFNGISRSLRSGGSFFVDFINREHLIRNFRKLWERELSDGSMLRTEPEYDMVRGRNIARRTVIPKGGVPQQIASLNYRLYSAVELIKMSAEAGLRFKEAYGDFEGGELTMDSRRALLVFEKP